MACTRGFLSGAFYFSVKILSRVPISQDIDCLLACGCYSPSYYCQGPMMVIPLVTIAMHLVLVVLLNSIFLPKVSLYNNI